MIIQFSDTDHFVYRLKRKFGSPDNYGYKLNSFSTDSFMQFMKTSGFRFLTKKGYSWQHVPINRLPFLLQFKLIKMARNFFPLSMFNSEWLVLLEMSDLDEK